MGNKKVIIQANNKKQDLDYLNLMFKIQYKILNQTKTIKNKMLTSVMLATLQLWNTDWIMSVIFYK